MADKKTPLEKEWDSFLKRENKTLKKYGTRKEPFWEKKLHKAVPDGLREKLEDAFYKAFCVILENGTGVIEKTFPKEKLEAEFKTREYAGRLYPVRKNLAAGRKLAARQAAAGVAGACAEGAVLGLLGIGLPDIPLFLAALLRGLYTQALHFGVDYRNPEEQELLLELLALSLYSGEDFKERDAAMNRKLYRMARRPHGDAPPEEAPAGVDAAALDASRALSGELLYMKFLQGVPIAGVIGGLYDGIYMKKVTGYAAIKLERRYLLGKSEEKRG
ncbi:EcsC family protein [[Clostridium] symbiosum]|uniref:EcsC family protein n=1 Tax=Clostridium symbiosum TaxID=1512 RepID=UPI001D073A9C|nr:EcsC family protein [[Clostridium] symbiosum]MCB6610532.1 EcsC family protein [[Clostridium] symbiosum]MCB6932727.1 EcsC family protein [[Clostridium] symbiosum]